MEATKAIEQLAAVKADQTVRVLRRWMPGDAPIRQGDIYLHPVPKDWPRGKVRGSRQVALGTSVGSRHVIEDEGATVYEGAKLPPGFTLPQGARIEDLLGPVVSSTSAKSLLTHPEHAHHQFPLTDCDAQVTYQFDMTTQRRVAD